MSDLNDLIHSNARVAFDQGVKTEQQRIVKLLEQNKCKTPNCPCFHCQVTRGLVTLIKGEQK